MLEYICSQKNPVLLLFYQLVQFGSYRNHFILPIWVPFWGLGLAVHAQWNVAKPQYCMASLCAGCERLTVHVGSMRACSVFRYSKHYDYCSVYTSIFGFQDLIAAIFTFGFTATFPILETVQYSCLFVKYHFPAMILCGEDRLERELI